MMYDVLDICRYVVNYSNDKQYGISNLKLQKLLYFIQVVFLIEKGRACFRESIEAWDFGPVVPEAYQEFKQFGSSNIPKIDSYILFSTANIWDAIRVEYNDSIIEDEDKKLINDVIDRLSVYSATDLVQITHNQTPWSEAYVPHMNREITIEAIRSYFDEQ